MFIPPLALIDNTTSLYVNFQCLLRLSWGPSIIFFFNCGQYTHLYCMLDIFISHRYLALWCVSSSKHQIEITVEVQIPIRGVSLDTATKPI